MTAREAAASAIEALDVVERWLAYRVWRTRVPGAQVAVWLDGEVRLARSFGLADVASGEALTNEHRFRIASHSKTFTATLVLQLAEEGALRLDDEVAEHVPALRDTAAARVTIRELLSHAGGVTRDSADSTFWSLLKPFPDAAAFDAILAEPLDVIVPSTSFKYTNIGYGILGHVVEAVDGRPWADALRARILEPLALTATHPDLDARARYATGHTAIHTDMARRPLANPASGALAPATGITSTARDVVRYAAAHFMGSGELLSDRLKRWMRQRQWDVTGRDGADGSYGLGLASRTIAGREWFGHGGGWPGHITRTLWEPELGVAVSVLTNAIDGPAEELAVGVVELIMASQMRDRADLVLESGHVRAERGGASQEVGDDAANVDLDRFVGRFESPWMLVDVVRLGDRLWAIPPSAANPIAAGDRLTVLDDDTLRLDEGTGYASRGEPLRFERDAAGRVVRITGGWRLEPAGDPVPYNQSPR